MKKDHVNLKVNVQLDGDFTCSRVLCPILDHWPWLDHNVNRTSVSNVGEDTYLNLAICLIHIVTVTFE